jgi:hypothetical protein
VEKPRVGEAPVKRIDQGPLRYERAGYTIPESTIRHHTGMTMRGFVGCRRDDAAQVARGEQQGGMSPLSDSLIPLTPTFPTVTLTGIDGRITYWGRGRQRLLRPPPLYMPI